MFAHFETAGREIEHLADLSRDDRGVGQAGTATTTTCWRDTLDPVRVGDLVQRHPVLPGLLARVTNRFRLVR